MSRVMMGVLLLLASGCVGHQQRFVRQQIPFTAWCNLTLIQDKRTGACFVAYHCGWRTNADLVEAPKEMCEP